MTFDARAAKLQRRLMFEELEATLQDTLRYHKEKIDAEFQRQATAAGKLRDWLDELERVDG